MLRYLLVLHVESTKSTPFPLDLTGYKRYFEDIRNYLTGMSIC